MKNKLPKSSTIYMLLSLIPYSEPNLKLIFKPSKFFSDLEKIEKLQKQNVKNAYYRAIKSGLIEFDQDNIPRLTAEGRQKISPYRAEKLGKHAKLLVAFDIPEHERYKRVRLRSLLKECGFTQKQKSVWVSEYDFRDLLRMEIAENELTDYVQVYEAHQLSI